MKFNPLMAAVPLGMALLMSQRNLTSEAEASLPAEDQEFETYLNETCDQMFEKIVNPDLLQHYKKKYPDGRPFLYPEESDQKKDGTM